MWRPPRSTRDRSAAASDVYKRQRRGDDARRAQVAQPRMAEHLGQASVAKGDARKTLRAAIGEAIDTFNRVSWGVAVRRRHQERRHRGDAITDTEPVSYTHLRAHETVLDLVCRLLLEKKKEHQAQNQTNNQQELHQDTHLV